MTAWLASERRVPFPRTVCDELRNLGTSVFELQQFITSAMAMPEKKRNKLHTAALIQYRQIQKECEMTIAENVSTTSNGGIFILKSTHGYEDKQTVKVEDATLSDIIAAKTAHKG